MFSSQRRRSALFLGRREFNSSGSAVTANKFKTANSPAADGTRQQFIEGALRVLRQKFLSAGDTDRLHRRTADGSRCTQHPRLAVTAREKFGGFVVVHDDFFIRVPLDFAADEHGDEPQAAGGCGMIDRTDR